MSQTEVRERWEMSVEAKALLLVTAVLLAFGLAVLLSASSIEGYQRFGSSSYFFMKQLAATGIGVVLFAVAAKVDAERWRELAWPIMIVAIAAMLILVLPFTPEALAPTIYGSRRSLVIPFVGSIQVSELAKLAVIVWTAMLAVKKSDQMRHLLKGMSPFLVVVGTLALLAALEPDISIALTFFLIMGIVLFTSGARVGHFLFLGLLGVPLLWRWFVNHPYAVQRILAVLHPGSGADEIKPQLAQSLIAVGSGGLFGQGFGEGMQQAGWVPLGYNDFIGSVIGEEFGFLGMLFTIAAYSAYGYLGYRIAINARSQFLKLTAVGITATMLFTAFVHLGVVTGLMPTTGLTLPFISYGRMNLLLSMLMTGILVNIGSTREKVYGHSGAERIPVAAT